MMHCVYHKIFLAAQGASNLTDLQIEGSKTFVYLLMGKYEFLGCPGKPFFGILNFKISQMARSLSRKNAWYPSSINSKGISNQDLAF